MEELIYNDDKHVAALFNIVFPDFFNGDKHVPALFNIAFPEILMMINT